ncbi:MFS general substrate transporter [Pseudovirgaria hyperparasitica]|uniref:MFS general substrate transporter n=1 Tax=Pseudovirgaria hyperparasitica TaxID=470096 RepID=A0A6A6WB23_9PEZI|nr:MFS general substrate transporter [Pseudovirgaria hyperparasitica]KAF2759379.1 MFS general substrate transporter [Pseudovirgaria hyperparasitica]
MTSIRSGAPLASTANVTEPQVALPHQEGDDADTPSNIRSHKEDRSTASWSERDAELGIDGLQEKNELQDSADEQDPNVVFWDEPIDQDPNNPINWKEGWKWMNIAVLAICTLITPLASSMFAPGVPQIMREFNTSDPKLATFVVSVYILGFAFGPLLVAPLSEMYGRTVCYHSCNVLFVIFAIGCAVSNSYGMLVAFRFLMGCAGSAPLTIGGGTIADMMPPERRGSAMAIWALGPLLGPVIGPVAGGFLVEGAGWRWVFWLLAIVGGVFTVLAFLLLRESYAPVLIGRKVARLRKETGNMNLRSKLDNGLTSKELLKRALVRPTKMLFLSPIVFLLSLYMAVAYAILYLLFTTFTFVFERSYGFSPGNVGLTYIPIGIGMIIGLAVLGTLSDRHIKALIAHGVTLQPEHRLPYLLTIPGGFCIPLGMFIYGWTAQYQVHWAVPLLGTIFVGIGLISCMMSINTYMIDAFTLHAASAMAANTVLRSLAGALLPLGGLQMYNALGLGWGNSLMGFIALALVPVPAVFKIYGPWLRNRFWVEF